MRWLALVALVLMGNTCSGPPVWDFHCDAAGDGGFPAGYCEVVAPVSADFLMVSWNMRDVEMDPTCTIPADSYLGGAKAQDSQGVGYSDRRQSTPDTPYGYRGPWIWRVVTYDVEAGDVLEIEAPRFSCTGEHVPRVPLYRFCVESDDCFRWYIMEYVEDAGEDCEPLPESWQGNVRCSVRNTHTDQLPNMVSTLTDLESGVPCATCHEGPWLVTLEELP